MKIRTAKSKDINGIYDVFLELANEEDKSLKKTSKTFLPIRKRRTDFTRSVKKELLREIKEKDSCYLVAEINNEVIGYSYGSIKKEKNAFFQTQTIGYANSVVVKKSFRGKGIGKMLIKERDKWFEKKKCKFIMLEVFSNNKAVKLHEKRGFKTIIYKMCKKT